jgi:ubiquinone/menaquinone biosynthesis C-methylase UbiE
MCYEIILIICVLCVVLISLKFLKRHAALIIGGARIVPITDLRDLPTKVEYTDDVTGETKMWNTKMELYRNPDSNQQFRTVVKYGSVSDYGRLIQLVGKFYRGPIQEIPKLLNKNDNEIYTELRRKFPRMNVDSSKRDGHHAYVMMRHLRHFIDKPQKYLDVGCNRGTITYEVGRLIGACETYGVDVMDTSHPDITYRKLKPDGTFDLESESFDLVTASMTLHHVEKLDTCVQEIMRVLRPGGLLFIREHDCWTVMDAMLVDIEHLLYDRVGGDVGSYNMYHYTNYYGWDELLKPFEHVKSDYYYMNLKNEISPTRSFWAVYRKHNSKK